MISPFPRMSSIWLIGAGFMAFAYFFAASGLGQQSKTADDKQKTDGPKPLVYGVKTCAGCHSLANPNDTRGLPPVLCRCNEALIWDKEDKHKLAYTNVFKPGGRGEQIVKLLNYSKQDTEKNCVVCHGIYIPEDKLNALTDSTFKRDQSEGVSCVACHGAYEDWIDPHGSSVERKRREWRQLSRQTKQEKYGMTDLWDPAKRTQVCASCHIGNLESGKVVTHAMYAAGHPPLPSFEISTFSDAMPRHWQYLYEKTAEAKKLLDYDPAVLEKTQLLIIGGVTELEASLNLLAGLAENCKQAKAPEDRALDLAAFDCYACHHDLKTPSWRQARGYSGKPGRPQFRPWPTALAPLALLPGEKSDFGSGQEKLSTLHAAFDSRPFGEPSRVAGAARDLQRLCGLLQGKLSRSSSSFNESAVPRSLQQLCALAAEQTPDYDSARQLAWAFRVLYDDLKPKPAKDALIQERLKLLNQELNLELPAGQQKQILSDLPAVLANIANYDPEKFKELFGELSRLLHEK
ncbi:MAG TPA: multiheme c-type cytochrome [Gemmataceae bacterium]|nr:multiheme c-type cytochrome [Gemmataceae bacterium]